MNSLLILVASAAVGIEAGWQPLEGGGHEYTLQIEPQLLELLKRNRAIESEVPPHIHIRRYRVTVGTGALARDDGPAQQNPSVAQQHEHPQADSNADPLDRPHEEKSANADSGQFSGDPQSPHPGADLAGNESSSQKQPSETRGEHGHRAPGKLPNGDDELPPLGDRQTSFAQATGTPPDGEQPSLKDAPRPWGPFLIALALLCCSLSANAYLGWIAWEARAKYRETLAKVGAAAS